MAIGTGSAILVGTALSAGANLLGGNEAADAQVAGTQASIRAEREALAQNRELFDVQRADFEPWRRAGGNALAALEYELGLGPRPRRTKRLSDYQIRRVDPPQDRGGAGPRTAAPAMPGGWVSDGQGGWENTFATGAQATPGGERPQQGSVPKPRFRVGRRNFGTREEARDFIDSRVNAPRNFNYRGFETTPGYEFRLGEGLDAIDASASARGGLFSGATMKAAQRYGEGLAAEEYGNYLARLGSMAGLGMDATGSQANLTGGLAGLEASAASRIGAASIAGGDARASGYANITNTFNNGIQNALGGLAYGGYLND